MDIVLGKSVGAGRSVNRPADVAKVQARLNECLIFMPPIKPITDTPGICGPSTIAAIKRFQRVVMGLRSQDGIISPKGQTLAVLNGVSALGPFAASRFHYPAEAQADLADIAWKHIDVHASHGMRMGKNPVMQKIFKADDYAPKGRTDGYNWCCSFVSLCLQEFLKKHRTKYAHVTAPRESWVHNFLHNWAPAQNCLQIDAGDPKQKPAKGDIAIFGERNRGSGKNLSHIGIVSDYFCDREIWLIEGNASSGGSMTGGQVCYLKRPVSKLRCFIRLPVVRENTQAHRAYSQMVQQIGQHTDRMLSGVINRQIAAFAEQISQHASR